MADRAAFAEARKRGRAHVRNKLAETVKPGRTSAGVTGPLWSEVVKASLQRRRPDLVAKAIGAEGRGNPECVQPEDVQEYNERCKSVFGMRVDNVCGISHGHSWAKRRQAEAEKGGPATASGTFGCWACKIARDRSRREQQAAGGAKGKRPRRTAASYAHEWQEEHDESELATTRHLVGGKCTAARHLFVGGAGTRQICALVRAGAACDAAMDRSEREVGSHATATVRGAIEAARTVQRGEELSDVQWNNRWAVLAGTLPAWAANGEESGPVKECATAIIEAQTAANGAVAAWKKAAGPGIEFGRQRQTHSGLMHLVLRLWREQIETRCEA